MRRCGSPGFHNGIKGREKRAGGRTITIGERHCHSVVVGEKLYPEVERNTRKWKWWKDPRFIGFHKEGDLGTEVA